MTHLILHIGWPKTGSTTIQGFLHENKALLTKHGLAYYASRGDSCGSVVRALAKGEALDEARTRFVNWADQQRAETVLISAEGFSGCDPQALAQFVTPARWQRITVLGWLRPQEEFLEGWYKQLVKWGSKQSLARYLAPGAAIWRQGDYRADLNRWADWCAQGGHDLRLRIFDRREMAGGDIGSDFLDAAGLPALPVTAVARNVSPSAALIGLYLRLPAIERLQKINRIMVASGHPAATGSRDLFPPELIARIRDHYREANEEIRARHFPDRAALFTPPVPARPPADPEGLAELLIRKIAKAHGPDCARRAEAALGAP